MKNKWVIILLLVVGVAVFAKMYSSNQIFTNLDREKSMDTSRDVLKNVTYGVNDDDGEYELAFYIGSRPVIAQFQDQSITAPRDVREISELNLWNPGLYFTSSLMPKDVLKKIPITDGWVFYSGLQSNKDDEKWVFTERDMKNSDFNVCLFNSRSEEKSVLFTQTSCPNRGLAFKPFSWSKDNDFVFMEALVFGSFEEHKGIWKYNISENSAEKLNISPYYSNTPLMSVDHKYLLYCASNERVDVHSESRELYAFDLVKQQEILLLKSNEPLVIIGWVVN